MKRTIALLSAGVLSVGTITFAMVGHDGHMFEENGEIGCAGWMWPSPNARSVKVWLRDPSGQLLAFQGWGRTDGSHHHVEARAQNVGSGTYTCSVQFDEVSDSDAEFDWMNFQFVY